MKIILDTNILVRYTVGDDAAQANVAAKCINAAQEVVIPTHVFCEYVWVLRSAYTQPVEVIVAAIQSIVRTDRIVVNDEDVEAGLRMLAAGGDFADGVNACSGSRMASGGAVFLSFDQKAVRLLNEQGVSASVPQ